jgi:hypothetical protein
MGSPPPLNPASRAAIEADYLDLEARCTGRPDDTAARRRLFQAFIALGEPEDLPGSTLQVPEEARALRIAALTPYSKEALAQLERCHRSVSRQTIPCAHIMVADGFPRLELDQWPITHLRVTAPTRNFGDTPRRIAGEAAIAAGFDAVVYVDADNWLRPRHVESLLACHFARRTPICHAARTLHRIDGTLMPLLQQSDNVEHVDTSCLFIAAAAFDLLPLWGTWPRELSLVDDRMLWQAVLARGYEHTFTGAPTVCYEASHAGFYHAVREIPPAGVRPDVDLDQLFAWHAALPAHERDDYDRRWGFSVSALVAKLRAMRGR